MLMSTSRHIENRGARNAQLRRPQTFGVNARCIGGLRKCDVVDPPVVRKRFAILLVGANTGPIALGPD